MTHLVFDIETIGFDFSTLDTTSQEALMKHAHTDEEKAQVPNTMGFSPLTGEIVAVALMNPESGKGAVYAQAPGVDPFDLEEDGVRYVSKTEPEILEEFWKAVSFYDQVVTFNGRGFDVPFLMVRSAIHKIRPSKNLMGNRYWDNHIDLYDRLGFFGAVRRTMGLHMWCKAFGIESSKDGGISGYQVPEFFANKRYMEIARYCFDDVRATAELFSYWSKYMNI
jgi:uncharacterized protein YprB with RNaseH-like and TPR domain